MEARRRLNAGKGGPRRVPRSSARRAKSTWSTLVRLGLSGAVECCSRGETGETRRSKRTEGVGKTRESGSDRRSDCRWVAETRTGFGSEGRARRGRVGWRVCLVREPEEDEAGRSGFLYLDRRGPAEGEATLLAGKRRTGKGRANRSGSATTRRRRAIEISGEMFQWDGQRSDQSAGQRLQGSAYRQVYGSVEEHEQDRSRRRRWKSFSRLRANEGANPFERGRVLRSRHRRRQWVARRRVP